MKTFLKYFAFIFLLTGLAPVAQANNTDQQVLDTALEKAITIAREHIKSANHEVRAGALNLFKTLISEKQAYDVALESALECISRDDLRVTGLELLCYLISYARYHRHQKSSGSFAIW